jgi:hypothetical protein
MVAAVRESQAMRAVAQEFGVRLSVVQRWVAWAADQPLDSVAWGGYRVGRRPRPAHRTKEDVETQVMEIHKYLREESDLGEYGALASRRELSARGGKDLPSVRTIGRILERRGALDGRRRRRLRAPAAGWFLPEVAACGAELGSPTSRASTDAGRTRSGSVSSSRSGRRWSGGRKRTCGPVATGTPSGSPQRPHGVTSLKLGNWTCRSPFKEK